MPSGYFEPFSLSSMPKNEKSPSKLYVFYYMLPTKYRVEFLLFEECINSIPLVDAWHKKPYNIYNKYYKY